MCRGQAGGPCEQLAVLAARGYYNSGKVLACEGTGNLSMFPLKATLPLSPVA